jgi:hypothetical protein
MKNSSSKSLGEELRKRFKSPREALLKLGIDPAIFTTKTFAFDSNLSPSRMAKSEIQNLVFKAIGDGEHYQKICELLDELSEPEVKGVDEEPPERQETPGRSKIREFCKSRGFSDKVVDEMFKRFGRDKLPRSAIEGGMGGRLASEDRHLASDQRRFRERWPDAARIEHCTYGERERPMAIDTAAAKSSADRWGELTGRITNA